MDRMSELDRAIERAREVANAFGITSLESARGMTEAFDGFFDMLKEEYPEAFDEDGGLRDDWMEMIALGVEGRTPDEH